MGCRDVSSSASSLFSNLVSSLQSTLSIEESRRLWMDTAATALCANELKIRLNSADYIISEVMKLDKTSALPLINAIRKATTDINGDVVQDEYKLWAIVNIVLQTRLLSLEGKEIKIDLDYPKLVELKIHASGNLTYSELLYACTCADTDLRLAALCLITSSLQSISKISVPEMEIFKFSFHYSLKTSSADHRHRYLNYI